jgi:glycerol-3-phosphate acyltransferase PlsY
MLTGISIPFLNLLIIFISYLVGSISFGLIIVRLMKLGDLRAIGSGNIGATNVLRTGNKLAASLTLLLDGGKGALIVFLSFHILDSISLQIATLAVFLGHLFPVWSKFKGGKGVATFLGIILALSPISGISACLIWMLVAVIFKRSSLSAILSAITVPFWLWHFNSKEFIFLSIVLNIFLIIKHRHNIARLISGTEPIIVLKNKA